MVSLKSLLKIPRQSFSSCPSVFHNDTAGLIPDLSKLDQVNKLLESIWIQVSVDSFTADLLSAEGPLLAAIVKFFTTKSPTDELAILDIFRKILLFGLPSCSRMECGLLKEFTQTISNRQKEEDPQKCICALTTPSGLLQLQETELNLKNGKSKLDKTRFAIYGLFLIGATRGGINPSIIPQSSPLIKNLAARIYKLGEGYLEGDDVWIKDFIDTMNWFDGARLLLYGNYILSVLERKSGAEVFALTSLPFYSIIDNLRRAKEANAYGITLEYLENMKLQADKLAATNNYTPAIQTYTIVAEASGTDVNSRVNCAALRLRVAKDTEIFQFHLVIIDCTYALELEPNHVKALFRRGLAHCKLKMWNEGIVDFQRAVELDPRPPAAKELAYALRQVGKRIGA